MTKKPSWQGKKIEEMTEKEKREYGKSRARRFTWEEGDLIYVGHEPLTKEEKEFVRQLKAQEETNNKSGELYFIKSGYNKFLYDVDENDPQKAITIKTSDDYIQKHFKDVIKSEYFVDYQGQIKQVAENLKEFFTEYIPHIFRLEEKIIHLEPLKIRGYGENEFFDEFKSKMSQNFSLSFNDFPLPDCPLYIMPHNHLIGSKEALKELIVTEGHINQFMNDKDDYFLMGYWGHGMNSYAFYYVRADAERKIFFRLPFGGAYTDNKKSANDINKFFSRYLDFEKKIKCKVKNFRAVRSMAWNSYYCIKLNNGVEIKDKSDRRYGDSFDYLLKRLDASLSVKKSPAIPYNTIFNNIENTLKEQSSLSEEEFNKRYGSFKYFQNRKLSDDEYFQQTVAVVFHSGIKANVILDHMETIKKYFHDYITVSEYNKEQISSILNDPDMIKNEKKIRACIKNAQTFRGIINDYGSFKEYVEIFNPLRSFEDLLLFKDELKYRFEFFGEITTYHFMTEMGLPVLKPDRVIARIFKRIGLIEETDQNLKTVIIGRKFSQATGYPVRYIDIIMVKYGQMGIDKYLGLKDGICLEKNPKCQICSVREYCNYFKSKNIYPDKLEVEFSCPDDNKPSLIQYKDGKLIYTDSKGNVKEKEPSSGMWEMFWHNLDNINLWDCYGDYTVHESGVCKGSVKISYNGKNVYFKGHDGYPEKFNRFIRVLKRLGRIR